MFLIYGGQPNPDENLQMLEEIRIKRVASRICGRGAEDKEIQEIHHRVLAY